MNPLVNLAIKAARRAGDIALRHQDRLDLINISEKGRKDFVSEVDKLIEADIIDTIHHHYPEHTIIAEESAFVEARAQARLASDIPTTWIVDPLDGTMNYLHGNFHYCISIAIQQNNIIEHAIIYDPVRNELFTATRGQGAQLNNHRIRVSGQKKLDYGVIHTNFPTRHMQHYDGWLKDFRGFLPKVQDVRISGSAALDLAYVACGRCEGFFQPGLDIWDVAAGSLLVREAGGLVSDYSGKHDYLAKKEIVCGNVALFNELLMKIKHNRKS